MNRQLLDMLYQEKYDAQEELERINNIDAFEGCAVEDCNVSLGAAVAKSENRDALRRIALIDALLDAYVGGERNTVALEADQRLRACVSGPLIVESIGP